MKARRLYRCNCPDGSVMLVQATDPNDAAFLLDEFAGVDPKWITEVEDFMIELGVRRLEERCELVILQAGERTWEAFSTQVEYEQYVPADQLPDVAINRDEDGRNVRIGVNAPRAPSPSAGTTPRLPRRRMRR